MKRHLIHATLICLAALCVWDCSNNRSPGQKDVTVSNLPSDSVGLSGYRQVIDRSLYSDPANTLQLCNAMIALSDSMDDKESRIYATTQSAWAHFLLGHPDSANWMADRAIEEGQSLKNGLLLGHASYIKGVILSNSIGPKQANVKFTESYVYYQSVNDSLGMATAKNGIGISYYGLGKYDSAVYNYLQAKYIAETKGYDDVLGKVYINLGTVYDLLGEREEAKSSYAKSIGINTRLNRFLFVSLAYNNTGNIMKREHQLDSARIMYVKALEISSAVGNLSASGDACSGLAGIEDQQGNYKKAAEFYRKAADYYERSGNQEGMLITFKNMGANEEMSGNYNKALTVYDSSLMIAREKGFLEREKEIQWAIYNNYRKQGKYLPALENLTLFYALKDSLTGLAKQERIAELEMKYEQEKYKAENLLLKNENLEKDLTLEHWMKQRNTLLIASSAVIIILLLFFIYSRRLDRKNRIISEQRIHQLEEEKKLLAARSIVEGQEEERKRIAKELHDGLGVLLSSAKMHFTTLRDYSPEARPMIEKATRLLEEATGDVRRISHNMMPGLLTKFGFYEAVEDLIEQVDEMKGIHAETKIEGEVTRLKENTEIMLYRIIQEMVNNTLKHAEAKNVSLQIIILPDQLSITYSDDGKGFDVDEKMKTKSFGLTSIQSRAKFLAGTSQIESRPGKGTVYNLWIPT